MRLKELRYEKGLTQAEVANAINTSQRNIGRWENDENEPTASYISKLALFFEVSTDYLLGREDEFGTPTAAPMGNTYSSEEREIISDFRELNAAGQKLIKETIKTLRANSSPC